MIEKGMGHRYTSFSILQFIDGPSTLVPAAPALIGRGTGSKPGCQCRVSVFYSFIGARRLLFHTPCPRHMGLAILLLDLSLRPHRICIGWTNRDGVSYPDALLHRSWHPRGRQQDTGPDDTIRAGSTCFRMYRQYWNAAYSSCGKDVRNGGESVDSVPALCGAGFAEEARVEPRPRLVSNRSRGSKLFDL